MILLFSISIKVKLVLSKLNQACKFRGVNFYNDRKVNSNKEEMAPLQRSVTLL